MKEVKDTVILIAIMLFAALLVNYADAATMLGRGGLMNYQFNKEWRAEYADRVMYGVEKDLIDIYWDDDEVYFYNGVYYIDNPDRGFQMIPLHFENLWERQEFEKDFVRYITEYSQEFVDSVNNPYNSGCKWGFYLYDGQYWVYQYDI